MRDFTNERSVRLYVRDTTAWQLLGWEGQAVWSLLYRKADDCGVVSIGASSPSEAIVALCGVPEQVAKAGLARCLAQHWLVHEPERLVIPRYVEANHTAKTSTQRVREFRGREQALQEERKRIVTSQGNDSLHETFHETPWNGRKRNVSGLGAADPSQETHRLAAAGAAWLSKATGQEPFPLTRRWFDSLVALAKKPDAQKALAARVLAQEAQKPDVLPMLHPDHVHSWWHCYGAGRVPGKAPARASNGRYAGPSRVATQAEYEADKTEKAPWET